MPVTHLISLRRYAPETTVPVLLDNKEAVQGSSQIIDYLEYKYPSPALTPENADDRRLCLEIEQTMERTMHNLVPGAPTSYSVYEIKLTALTRPYPHWD